MSHFHDEQTYNNDHSPESQNRPVRNGDEPKNEWQELIQHQADITKWMQDKEKEMKTIKSRHMNDELLKIVNEKEAQKQLLTEDRKRDAEFTRKLKEDYDREVESKKQAKLYEQRTLADSYQQHNQRLSQEQILKKENERRLEEQMIQNSINSLEQEKLAKKRQLESYRRSANDLLKEREMQRKQEQERSKMESQNDHFLSASEKVTEQMRNENYKQYYDQWSNTRKTIEGMHSEKVLRSEYDKKQKIDDFVQKGIRDQQARWEMEKEQQLRKSQDNKNQLISTLKYQINQKERTKLEDKMSYPQKAERVVQDSSDYQKYLDSLQNRKHEQQKNYKEVLDRQYQEQEDKKRNVDKMNERERTLNMQDLSRYKNAELKIDGLIPGVSSSQLNHLVSPSHYISTKNISRHTQDFGTNLIASSDHSGHQSPATGAGQKFFGGKDEINTNYQARSPSYGNVNRSVEIQQDIQRHIHNTNASSPYNPITNPIPNFNQNPYFRGGQRDTAVPRKNILAMAADNNIFG